MSEEKNEAAPLTETPAAGAVATVIDGTSKTAGKKSPAPAKNNDTPKRPAKKPAAKPAAAKKDSLENGAEDFLALEEKNYQKRMSREAESIAESANDFDASGHDPQARKIAREQQKNS